MTTATKLALPSQRAAGPNLAVSSKDAGGYALADIAALLSEAAVEIGNLDSPQNIVACRCRKALSELPRTFCAGEVAISVGCNPLDVILAAESAGASHFTANGKAFSRLHYEAYPDGWLEDVEFSAQPGKLAAALQVEESEVLA